MVDPIANLSQMRILSIWIFFNNICVNLFPRWHRYIQILDRKISHHCCLLRLSRGKGSCLVSWCHSKQGNNNKFDKRARNFKLSLQNWEWSSAFRRKQTQCNGAGEFILAVKLAVIPESSHFEKLAHFSTTIHILTTWIRRNTISQHFYVLE